jgi:transcription factor SPN1
MQIEAILRPKKSSRPKKRKANEEVLDSYADDEVAKLRNAMIEAADADITSKELHRPAVAKLRLLPYAVETMQK